MGWTRADSGVPDRWDYSLKETLLRPLLEGEVCQALDAWSDDQGKEQLAGWVPDPEVTYRVWRDGQEVLSFRPEDLGEVVSERRLTRAHSSHRVPMSPGMVLAPGVVLFRTFHWDWEVVLPTGRIKVKYGASPKVPIPLSLVEFVHHEHGLALFPRSKTKRQLFGAIHKDVEVPVRRGTRCLARITKALDLCGAPRLYVKVKVAFDVELTRCKLAELAHQEGWIYSSDSFFSQWLRGERADAGDQESPDFESWARGGETVFGYTGDEIRLP